MEHIQWQREEIQHKCDSYKLINDYCYGWENSSINHLLKLIPSKMPVNYCRH